MGNKGRLVLGTMIGAAALMASVKARGVSSAAPDGELRYQTSCSIVDSNAVDGYVLNLDKHQYQVRGEVRFKFIQSNSMSRPVIQVQADSLVPAGDATLVSHARLAFEPLPGEGCFFDVVGAVRSQ